MVYFEDRKKNYVTLIDSAQKKHFYFVKTKEKDKSNKVTPWKNIPLDYYTTDWDTGLPDY